MWGTAYVGISPNISPAELCPLVLQDIFLWAQKKGYMLSWVPDKQRYISRFSVIPATIIIPALPGKGTKCINLMENIVKEEKKWYPRSTLFDLTKYLCVHTTLWKALAKLVSPCRCQRAPVLECLWTWGMHRRSVSVSYATLFKSAQHARLLEDHMSTSFGFTLLSNQQWGEINGLNKQKNCSNC